MTVVRFRCGDGVVREGRVIVRDAIGYVVQVDGELFRREVSRRDLLPPPPSGRRARPRRFRGNGHGGGGRND